MKNLVVTEVNLPVRLQRFGILHYLEDEDVQFYIPDLCYYEQLATGDLSMPDIALSKLLISQGKLKVVSLSGSQITHVISLLNGCCSMFLARTVAAMVYARIMGYTLVSENHPLRVISYQQLGISISKYESVSVGLLQDIISRGINLEIGMLHELI
ncbi:hypothetical protein [Larkinella humicola]|uniref:Uncharacterized protein n=1 Tax=Larkinella humicola TaxID=2607654 RepID=A0A5N1JB70_9BACT|nr:hypothetical protein [Larkinella humicola]KAA9349731.1 hypothetical protein F0P93_19970 [Larkinella humicola]